MLLSSVNESLINFFVFRFELELERALEASVPVIVIEPVRLGDETARWIAVGNCLHKTSVLAGLGSVITGN